MLNSLFAKYKSAANVCCFWGLVLGLGFALPAQAEVCFLPSGGCQSDIVLGATYATEVHDCTGDYDSTYINTGRNQISNATCVYCNGAYHCKCPNSAMEIADGLCKCSGNKVFNGTSCVACSSPKEPNDDKTSCVCPDRYEVYSPSDNHQVCSDSCSMLSADSLASLMAATSNNSVSVALSTTNTRTSRGAAQIAQTLQQTNYTVASAPAATMAHSATMAQSATTAQATTFTQAATLPRTTVSRETVYNNALSQFATINTQLAQTNLTEARRQELLNQRAALGQAYSTSLVLYDISSCSCTGDYEEFGGVCVPKCIGSGTTRDSSGNCGCTDPKKEYNASTGCECKDIYDPDGNGGCVNKTCAYPSQQVYNTNTKQCECDESKHYFGSLAKCNTYIANHLAYNQTWWQMLQQYASSALNEVAQCLTPIKSAYAAGELVFENIDDTFDPAEADPTCQQCLGWFECNSNDSVLLAGGGSWSGGTESFYEKRVYRSKCNQICGYQIPTYCNSVTNDPEDTSTEYECVTDNNVCWYPKEKEVVNTDWLIIYDDITKDCIDVESFTVNGTVCPDLRCKIYKGQTMTINYSLKEMGPDEHCTFEGFYIRGKKLTSNKFTLDEETIATYLTDYGYWNQDVDETPILSYESYWEDEEEPDEIEVLIEDADPDEDEVCRDYWCEDYYTRYHKIVYRYVSGQDGLDKLRESGWYVDLRVYLKDRYDTYTSSCDGNILADYPKCYDQFIDQGSPIPYVYKKKLEIGKIGGSGAATYTVTNSGCQEIPGIDVKVCLDTY